MSLGYGSVTQGGGNSAMEFSKLYDPLHMTRVVETMMFDKFAQERFIPANAGVKTMFAFRYRSLRAATTPLTEGVLPSEVTPVREKVEFTVSQYGSYMIYTDVFDLFDVDSVKSQFIDVLSDQAALTGDVVIRDAISSGSKVIYAGTATTRALVQAGTVANVVPTTSDLKLAVLHLKNAKAKKYKTIVTGSLKIGTKPVRDAFVGIVHPNVVEDLRGLGTGWKDVEEYAYSNDLFDGEVGSYGDIRFIENTNAKVVGGGTNNIYVTLIMGQEAYASVSVKGNNGTQMIYKPLDSGGVENALNQKGSIGWKMYCGAKIINELFMIRIESAATNDVASMIRYDDNTATVNDAANVIA